MAKQKKLTKLQLELLDLMHNGWELGVSTTFDGGSPWVQKGGIGKGGESRRFHWNTVAPLETAGLIKRHYAFPTAKFTLVKP